MDNEISAFGRGWAFLKDCGKSHDLLPEPGPDLREWVHGYAAALADYDPMGDCSSIEAALRNDGVEGETLESLLQAAEAIERGDDCTSEFCRWPGVPVRHSVQALHAWDERVARNAGLLDGEDWPRGWHEIEAGHEMA